jgi:hypothetical protein
MDPAATKAGLVPVCTSRGQALAAPLAAAGAVAAATAILHQTNGRDLGPLATCWFHAWTGLYCPFCGSLRGVAALSHGDVLDALHDNAPVIALLCVATLLWGRRVYFALVAGKVVNQPAVNRRAGIALIALFVLFAIYRNTPYGGWLAPLS